MGKLPELCADAVCHVRFFGYSGHFLTELVATAKASARLCADQITSTSPRVEGATSLRASSLHSSTWTRAGYPFFLLLFHLLRHSSERCCTCCFSCIGTGWSGSPPSLLSIDYLGGSQICIYTRSIASRQRNGRLSSQPFRIFFFFRHVASQGVPNSKVVRSRESDHIPGVMPILALRAGWLVGRQATTVLNRKGEAYWYAGGCVVASGYRPGSRWIAHRGEPVAELEGGSVVFFVVQLRLGTGGGWQQCGL